jgi:ADP-ribosylglycohydrolase
MQLPRDYAERVYAGVLGKIIGVYLGRPFEGWEHARIERELGEITGYVHERFGVPLIVTDDDISGTFTFIRALEDFAASADISAADIGRTWLNYLIEERTVLWWGGLGNSTEHTAYLRLKHGVEAPRSGSIALNSKVVAEQIGAQIFIDGWAMVAPGDPELAAALAAKAGSVSHDGEAVYGAQVVAAMEAAAFTESSIDALLDTAVRFIPADSVIARLIADIREWHAADGDWRNGFARVQGSYGYDRYGGNCHMVPNHAIIILALLYGAGDFAHSLMIANTCGWDTDCNSGNVGCVLGIRGGLEAIDASKADGNGAGKWRGPVADRFYLPTADGGRCITDAVQQSYRLINLGRGLRGLDPLQPKQGARYHFSLPGSVQGFQPEGAATSLANDGGRLALQFDGVDADGSGGASTATFIPMDADKVGGYQLLASPTLHSGQRIRAQVDLDGAASGAVACRLYATVVRAEDDVATMTSDAVELVPGTGSELVWEMPDTNGYPVARVGITVSSAAPDGAAVAGMLYLDWLTWDGAPRANLSRPSGAATERSKLPALPWWGRAWVNGCSTFWAKNWAEPIRLIQNEGVGVAFQGGETWTDYRVTATMRIHMGKAGGIGARAGGMHRYYALLIGGDGVVRLVRHVNERTELASAPLTGELTACHRLTLEVSGSTIRGTVDDGPPLTATDDALRGGAVALVGEEGRVEFHRVTIAPA